MLRSSRAYRGMGPAVLAALALAAWGCATGSATNQLDAAPQQDAAPVQDDAALDAPADVAAQDVAAPDVAVDTAAQDAQHDTAPDVQQDTAPQDAQHDTAPAGCTDDTGCNVAGGEHCFVQRGKCYTPGQCTTNEECLSNQCNLLLGTCTCNPFFLVLCRDHESCFPLLYVNICQAE